MKRDFTYIDDIVSGTRAAIDKNFKSEVFNLGNHSSEDLMHIVELIEKNIGKTAKIQFKPMQLGDVPESYADIEKSKKLLGFIPKTNVDSGIIKFINWYKSYYQQ